MRADILRIPVKVSEVSESTVLGASMFAFAGAGVAYSTPEQARAAFSITYRTYMPGSQEAPPTKSSTNNTLLNMSEDWSISPPCPAKCSHGKNTTPSRGRK